MLQQGITRLNNLKEFAQAVESLEQVIQTAGFGLPPFRIFHCFTNLDLGYGMKSCTPGPERV
jgi:hypothetical protein